MCDFESGQLVIGVPNSEAGARAVREIRSRTVIPDCHYDHSMVDRLAKLGVDTGHFDRSKYLYHLLQVPPGDETYISNELVHNFNGRPGGPGSIALACSSVAPSAKDFSPNLTLHDKIKQELNVKGAHGNGNRGKGVTICVLDTGLAQASPARNSSSYSSQSLYSYDLLNNSKGVPDDGNGHGSSVSWIIHDIAPDSDLVILRVANDQGRSQEWDAVAAIFVALSVRADLINFSLEFGLGTTACRSCGRASQSSKSAVFEGSIDRCHSLLVAATGNGGKKEPSYPARFQNVAAIGSINLAKNRSSFSNHGVSHANFFVMPGGELARTGGQADEYIGDSVDGTRHFAGTSIACAYATGLIGLYKAAYPTSDNDTLLRTVGANVKMEQGWTADEYGQGLIEFA
jgi:subtilisin family serine protease